MALDLGLHYLDTGAMYRALTWWMLGHGIDVADPAAVLARLGEPRLTVVPDAAAPQIYVDGQDVAVPIRTREVSNAVSLVAALPPVRDLLIGMQRRIIAAAAQAAGIVAEGRDIGMVVAPDADIKVYLTASEEARAQRRSADLAADPAATVEATRREQATRDKLDAAQMVMAADAIPIDTTESGVDDVVARIVALVRARQAMMSGG